MRLIHLSSVDSTNSYLSELNSKEDLPNYSAVLADYQSNGRGQRGNTWESHKDTNLLCSISFSPRKLEAANSFVLNAWVSIAVLGVLKDLKVQGVKVKWPNDVLVGNKKVAGILIENTLSGEQVRRAVIGIGLNIHSAPENVEAVSLSELVKGTFSPREILLKIIERLRETESLLERRETLHKVYELNMFGKNNELPFTGVSGEFVAVVEGISPFGKLMLSTNGQSQEYDFQEVKWRLSS